MTYTFKLQDVPLGELLPSTDVLSRLRAADKAEPNRWDPNPASKLGLKTVEGFGASTKQVINLSFPVNGFLQAIRTAFDQHLPLTLSPDDVWIAIAQGFALHVLNDPEDLRQQFVPGTKEGEKQFICIQRDHFIKGAPNNYWPGCFDEFGEKIGEKIGEEKLRLVRSNFSTTTPVHKAVSEIVLMESMSAYFEYGMRTCCGIPSVTLLGTVDDWKDVVARAQALSEFKLDWWTDTLVPTLDKIVQSAEGDPDTAFWKDIYNLSGGSGGPFVGGWVNHFFPYIGSGEKPHRNVFGRFGNTIDEFPPGLSKVPFIWYYYASEFKMEFLGGFVGASQDPDTLAVRPSVGWLVQDTKE